MILISMKKLINMAAFIINGALNDGRNRKKEKETETPKYLGSCSKERQKDFFTEK